MKFTITAIGPDAPVEVTLEASSREDARWIIAHDPRMIGLKPIWTTLKAKKGRIE